MTFIAIPTALLYTSVILTGKLLPRKLKCIIYLNHRLHTGVEFAYKNTWNNKILKKLKLAKS